MVCCSEVTAFPAKGGMTLQRPWGLYKLEREKKMKKVLLVTASLIALGAAAPAVAADLAARPYTKAPPMIAAVYDWSGFYIGANGGWGSSRKCWDAVTGAGAFIEIGRASCRERVLNLV